MKIFKLDKIPEKSYLWTDGGSEEFSKYELEELYATNADAAFYWYCTGSYEGSGQLLILKDKKWYLHDCGHCSCYGPTDSLSLDTPISDSLSGIQEKCSEDLWYSVKPLVDLAQKNGYKDKIEVKKTKIKDSKEKRKS